jgi:hypothetical protein
MDRRRFVVKLCVSLGLTSLAVRLIGCGQAPTKAAASSLRDDESTRTVLVYDLVMEGWSTLGSGYLGDNGILRAAQIRAFTALDLEYVQDPHGHVFALGEENFAALLRGEETRVLTTYALDHRHEVRIKPSRRVTGSTPLEVVVDADGRPVGR